MMSKNSREKSADQEFSLSHRNENHRISELLSYDILDTPEEESFDALVKLASRICDAPIAMVNFLDKDRQWTKSSVGWDIKEMPRKKSFCNYTIEQDTFLHVPDATADERFKNSQFVTGNPNIRFYAGVNLKSPNNANLGSLCIIDNKKRELTGEQKESLQIIAKEVEARLELRRKTLELAKKNVELERKTRFLSNSAELMILIDPEFYKIIHINKEASEVLGTDKADLIGSPLTVLGPGKKFIEALNIWAKSETEETFQFEVRLKVRNGKEQWFQFRVTEDQGLWYATAQNIHKRKLIQRNLDEALKNMRISQRIAKVGSYTWYPPTNKVYISAETHRLFGLDPDQVNLDMPGFFDVIHPDDQELVKKTIEKVASGGPKDPYEYRIVKPDGSIRHMLNRGEIQRDKSGKAIKVSGSTQDITEQKEYEKNILETLKEKDLMLAEIHHRVKNNLAVISSMLELQVYQTENEESLDVLETAIAKIKSMALIHENLYQNEKFTHIPFSKILNELIEIALPKSDSENEFALDIQAENNISLNINQAIPFALIINHLVKMTHSDVSFEELNKQRGIKLYGSDEEIYLSISNLDERFLHKIKRNLKDESEFSTLLLKTLLDQLNANLLIVELKEELIIEFKKENKKGSSAANF